MFVKQAFVQAKLDPATTFRLGAADMPWIPFDESIYGYHFVENTLIDRLHFGHSTDWGVHFYYNAGISFPANRNITWVVAYKYEDLADNTTHLKNREIGVWAQVKFWVILSGDWEIGIGGEGSRGQSRTGTFLTVHWLAHDSNVAKPPPPMWISPRLGIPCDLDGQAWHVCRTGLGLHWRIPRTGAPKGANQADRRFFMFGLERRRPKLRNP
ncbi:MAG: hypothetical protein ACRESQ_04380 [Gammaproteobacteria bacterium]